MNFKKDTRYRYEKPIIQTIFGILFVLGGLTNLVLGIAGGEALNIILGLLITPVGGFLLWFLFGKKKDKVASATQFMPPLSASEPAVQPETQFCPACGAELGEDMGYCMICGYKAR